MEYKYIVIICDIVSSRTETNRNYLQNRLNDTLDSLNLNRRDVIASPCTVTIGDEFQAVYIEPSGLFADLWRITAALHPVRARYSIALGSLNTPINKSQAIGMDGPAFHVAWDALEKAKKLKSMFRVGGSIANLNLINESLMLISNLAKDWNSNRLAIEADLSKRIPVKQIAKRVGITEAGVYKNI